MNFFYIKCIKIHFFCVFLLLLKLVFSFIKKNPCDTCITGLCINYAEVLMYFNACIYIVNALADASIKAFKA